MKEYHQSYQDLVSKSVLRKIIKEQRKSIDFSKLVLKSKEITRTLLSQDLLKSTTIKNVALYSPIHREVDTKYIDIQLRKLNKSIFYPKIINKRMRFYQASSLSDFSLGYQGIQEPISDRLINSKNIDIFIVPALAINSLGYRLGYGQGFYDKELKGIPTRKIYSVIFDFQFINSQFDQSHDIKVKKVFTEKGVYTIN